MSRPRRRSRGVLAAAVGSALIIAALLVAGLVPTIRTRTYALREPDFTPAAHLTPGHRACEAPIVSDGRARAVEIFGVVVRGDPRVAVDVRSTRGQVIARGRIHHPRRSHQQIVRLDRLVPSGVPVRVCVRTAGGAYDLRGTGASNAQIDATGVVPGTQFALLLTRARPYLSSVPTAFARASLFRPAWVGPWFFWLLLALLAATFLVAILGVRAASRADRRGEAPDDSTFADGDSP